MSVLEINGRSIRVSLQPSPRARKTVEIKFISSNELVIRHPSGVKLDVESLIGEHRASIERSYALYLSQRHILDGDVLLVDGKPRNIVVHRHYSVEKLGVVDDGESMTILVDQRADPSFFLREWIKVRTSEAVAKVQESYRGELGEPSRVFVTETARWGYCRRNGEVIINWQLSCLPLHLQEYVIIHELVHLRVRNHQKEFHGTMLKILPDYEKREAELGYYITFDTDQIKATLK